MRSRELLRRLARLEPPVEKPPEKVLDTSVLSLVQESRLLELRHAAQEEGITTEEKKEFWTLMLRCPLVYPSECGHRDWEERHQRQSYESSFDLAFRDYATKYSYIAVPKYYNALNEYRHDLGYRLFEKYGWTGGTGNSSGILPLDQWASEDRDRLIDLYQRSNPESTAAFPAGWMSKYKEGRGF